MFGVTLSFFPAKNLHGFKVIFDANAKDRPSLFVHEHLARGEAVIAGKEGEKNAVEIGTARTTFGLLQVSLQFGTLLIRRNQDQDPTI